MTINPDGRRYSEGVTPSGSGYSAEPEPCSTVSAVPVSIPNAARFYVAETPNGLWPFAVMDRERGTWIARCNDRKDAEEECVQRNGAS